MAFNHVNTQRTENGAASVTTVAVTLTNVQAGNLVVVWVNPGDSTLSSVSDGSNLTLGTRVNGQAGVVSAVQPAWRLISGATGNKTYTATVTPATGFMSITASEYSYSGTAEMDVEDAGATGTNPSAPTTTGITTTGTVEVAICHLTHNNGTQTISSLQIGGSAANERTAAGGVTHIFDRILSATMSSGTGTCALGGGAGVGWTIGMVSFKEAAAGGPGNLAVVLGEPTVGSASF